MLAPKIHDAALREQGRVGDLGAGLGPVGLGVGLDVDPAGLGGRRRCRMASAIHSTWASIVGGRLVNGPLGPRIMNMLGNPVVATPR